MGIAVMPFKISFNRPCLTGNEITYIREALANTHISGDGEFTRRCHAWLEQRLSVPQTLLTHSCTGALEMAALLGDLQPGDEVIMPSYTFVSTANAVALRGAVPVFVDIRPDTLNLDEALIEGAITPQTRAIFVVHYAGVSCEMDRIMEIARRHQLLVVEDAAQALLSTYRGRPLGSIGDLAAFSFHETKNFISGEGGALVVNNPTFRERAEIIREKGTNRSRFFRGEVDKYTWVDIGSSYLPSDMLAAFLFAQLENSDQLLAKRREIWNFYHDGLAELEKAGLLRRPIIPTECGHNAHIYYILVETAEIRSDLIAYLKALEISAPFHYVPLHSSPAGRRLGREGGPLPITEDVADRLIRLPLWYAMTDEPKIVLEQVQRFLDS
ncbi:MAG: dTDP-4-amino-4,6-dideoxygalactose transaminase [Negativicutes bacterium]|nr:dTDP-4-amino-4,6-dideoxygalactose transaminase [Negativicutes bacterium]